MEKLHLLCNAHLDPAWLWRWNEGLAEAISTFRVAADFCEEYDGFVFNHNEALLYEWVEEHEPQLFARIQKLVKEKKWVIMGGWYLQPDCVMTSGESLLEQINLGREYFMEKFGVAPKTAINLDPFGHSRGLVQILAKTGYDSYLYMRPWGNRWDFLWEGFDGSRILTHGIFGGYNTARGGALSKIKECLKTEGREVGLCLWGIGDHGGGPSRIDLEQINEYISVADAQIIHSSADAYTAEIDRSNLRVVDRSLIACMVGCYTSMVRIKQANRRLENKIALTEKAMSYVTMSNGQENGSQEYFDYKELKKAKKALAFCQFHDILPGSGIRQVEEDSLRTLGYGEEIVDRLYTKAFFKLCEGQKKAKEGEIPIMVFNPHPYEIQGEFEVEFMLADQNWNEDEQTLAVVYDREGRELPTQNEKPQCTFNLDWIQKVSFTGKLAPASITRFDCRLTTVKKDTIPAILCSPDHVEVKNSRMTARISRSTGLIDWYEVDGKPYIADSGRIEVYRDNEDPWGMTVESFKEYEGCFELMSEEEANAFVGYPEEKISNVRVVEDGRVRTKVQAFFRYKRSVAVVEYTLPKDGAYIDVDILMYSNEPNKMIKYHLDTQIEGTPYGETAFGSEALFEDEREAVYHKWCGIRGEDAALYVVNRGIYGGSFTRNSVKLSLLRTPIYAAHPIEKRQIAPHNRLVKHMDMGEREFSFRITTEKNIAKEAQVYNEAPQLLSFFPSGGGCERSSVVTLDHPDIILSSVKKKGEGYELVLFNTSEQERDAELNLIAEGEKMQLHFGKYELKIMTV